MSEMPNPSMQKAYRLAHEMVRDRLKATIPEAACDLDSLRESDIVVVRGQYDHIEQVLRQAGTACIAVNPAEVGGAELRPDQVVFVNCPGQIPPKGLRRLATFVHEGGFLFTTDWALKHVIEPAFPGFLVFNERPTTDEVVRVELVEADDPYLRSLIGPSDDPQWWLEGSSYPIRVLNTESVKVLVRSREIEERYGESPVLVTFEHGQGKIYHMISHFYLQRSETRTLRHRSSSADYLAEKGLTTAALRAKYEALGVESAQLGEVESAFASAGYMSFALLEKKRRLREAQERKVREMEEGQRREQDPGDGKPG
jgi:hypothetical protein